MPVVPSSVGAAPYGVDAIRLLVRDHSGTRALVEGSIGGVDVVFEATATDDGWSIVRGWHHSGCFSLPLGSDGSVVRGEE